MLIYLGPRHFKVFPKKWRRVEMSRDIDGANSDELSYLYGVQTTRYIKDLNFETRRTTYRRQNYFHLFSFVTQDFMEFVLLVKQN